MPTAGPPNAPWAEPTAVPMAGPTAVQKTDPITTLTALAPFSIVGAANAYADAAKAYRHAFDAKELCRIQCEQITKAEMKTWAPVRNGPA